jgi:lipoprotein-anchoring transpeptidase ErfK/SrfK
MVGSSKRPKRLRTPILALFTIGCLSAGGWIWRARAAEPELPATPLRAACKGAGVKYPPPSPRVEIDKAGRRLALFSGTTRLKEYRVALGVSGTPTRTKTRQGDCQTPTGEYYICTRLQRSRFHRFLGLSYPGPADAVVALRERRITAAQHKAIVAAHRKRVQPPWGTPMGGAVGIHGSGAGMDWTAGCVALEDSDIEELFAVLPLGTPVTLRNSLNR